MTVSYRQGIHLPDLDLWLAGAPVRTYPPVSEDGDTATYLDWIIQWDRVRQAIWRAARRGAWIGPAQLAVADAPRNR